MSAPLFSIGGIASGLPPDLVDQLMAAERIPVRRLESRQNVVEIEKEAWKQVNTRLSALRSAVDDVRRPASFSDLVSVSSSNEDAVTVSRNGRPAEGSQSFTVSQLATAMQRSVDDTFAGLDDTLGGRTLSITAGGQTVDVTPATADATLQDLVDAVNAADVGVRASTIQVTPGAYRLVLSAESTGTQAAFTAAGTGWVDDAGGTAVDWATDADSLIADAADAQLTIGSGAQAITVTRASNSIADLYDGMTVDLHAVTTDPVTISAQRDVDGAVDAVRTLVEKLNAAITTLEQLSDYDAETGRAGPLQGDATVRSLLSDLRGTLLAPVAPDAGRFGYAGGVGISIRRDGTFTVDEARLRDAFTTDFRATSDLFARRGSSDSTAVSYLAHGAVTATGELTVAVTKKAIVAGLTGAVAIPPPETQTYRITTASGDVVVELPAGASVNDAVRQIQAVLDANGSTVQVSDDGGQLALTETVAGSARVITVELQQADGTWSQTGTAVGGDAVADITFGGVTTSHTATGTRIAVDDGALDGLRLAVDGAAGATATVTLSQGLGGVLDQALSRAEGVDGSIRRAQDAADRRIDQLQDQIDRFEVRLELRRQTISKQFLAMETAMAGLQSQGNWLAAQLPGLQANAPKPNS